VLERQRRAALVAVVVDAAAEKGRVGAQGDIADRQHGAIVVNAAAVVEMNSAIGDGQAGNEIGLAGCQVKHAVDAAAVNRQQVRAGARMVTLLLTENCPLVSRIFWPLSTGSKVMVSSLFACGWRRGNREKFALNE
jgi:hypothetical protein